MQQKTRGLLVFIFLISVSIFGINLFNNNDPEENPKVTQTTLFEATTTTSPAIKIEKYIYSSVEKHQTGAGQFLMSLLTIENFLKELEN